MLFELSCDLGEAVTPEAIAVEAALWPLIGAANVACGGHVGDEASMRSAVASALRCGVVLGAHPSYPDRERFGRRSIAIDAGALRESLTRQIASLAAIAAAEGAVLLRVKPHGALYNDAHRYLALAKVVAAGVVAVGSPLVIVGTAGGALEEATRAAGLAFVREAFADRRYRSDGSLVPRGEPGALLEDPEEAAGQAARLAASGSVVCDTGALIAVPFDTICIHSDMEGAVERASLIRERLMRSTRPAS
jgi:5-oxoprolinase (ATP-hydrolysing) subunit A